MNLIGGRNVSKGRGGRVGEVWLKVPAQIILEYRGVDWRKMKRMRSELEEVRKQTGVVDLEVTGDYVLRLNEVTDIVTPRKLFNVPVREREDAKIIECAYFGDSNYIVTGDRDLPSLKRYKRTKILSPSKVIKILRHEKRTV